MGYPDTPGYKVLGTSREAVLRVTPRARRLLDRVHNFMKSRYPAAFSADQVAEELGETILSVRPRMSELLRHGKIECTGARRKNQSGMTANCYRAIDPSEEGFA
jgi:hypothetical protein